MSPPDDPATLDDPELREALKRCSPATYFAACKFRQTGDSAHLAELITGVVERYIERDLRARLSTGNATLLLREDLGLDSLTMMEIVMLAEEVLHISISNDELSRLRTLGDVHAFFETKLRLPSAARPGRLTGSDSDRAACGPQADGTALVALRTHEAR